MSKVCAFIIGVIIAQVILYFYPFPWFADNIDYKKIIKIDSIYKICSGKSKNPFEKQSIQTVIITDTSGNFVQYTWPDKLNSELRFSRTYEQFYDLTKDCNP